jgi:hypothetical protein
MSADLPPFDPASPKPNSTINPPERVAMTPSWDVDAEAQKKDVAAAAIDSPNVNGEYGTLDGSRPATLERLQGGAFLDTDALLGAGGEKRRYPY